MAATSTKKPEVGASSSAAMAGAGADADDENRHGGGGKKELTKKEKEARRKEKERIERELRRAMPPLKEVGRNGCFEIIGQLGYTWAQGSVPGGPFVPVNVVARAHNLYIFDGGEAGQRPSAKPRAFFQIKRAEVLKIGLLVIPNSGLPPHTNVFKVSFMKKQFGHKAFFFKAMHAQGAAKEMERWLKDLQWRVNASEGELKRKFEPDRTREVVRKRTDETETGIFLPPERVLGLAVRYETRKAAAEAGLEDDF